MRREHKARRLLGDLLIPVAVLLCVGAILLTEQMGYKGKQAPWYPEMLIDQDRWEALVAQEPPEKPYSGRSALLVTAVGDEGSAAVYEQVRFVLSSMFVDVQELALTIHEEPAEPEVTAETTEDAEDEAAEPAPFIIPETDLTAHLPEGCTDVILCTSALRSTGMRADTLAQWVRGGGHLMVAASLETEELTEDWYELLGLSAVLGEQDVPVDSMYFETAFLAGGKGREFSEEVINCTVADVMLASGCQVHVTRGDDRTRPLVWERKHGSGQVLVCNADLMADKTGRGMICTGFARMGTAFVYPVINAAVYCIDDFPSVAPAGYDSNVLSQFGYTVEDYYVNVWWPAMQKLAKKYDLRYSSFVIQCYESDVDGPFTNADHRPSASYFARQLLESGCEIGLHGYNHQPMVLEGYVLDEKNSGYTPWPSTEHMMEAVRAGVAYTESLAEDVHVQSYVAPSNVISREAMSAMIRHFEDIRVFAGVYVGTPDQLVQEFTVLDEAVVQVPRLTADMQMEDSEWWLQVNELNYHYYESNFIHPDDILDEERTDGGDFRAMLDSYEQMVVWNQAHGLRTCTVSEAAGAVQRYSRLSVSQYPETDGMCIHVDGVIDSAYLMLRSTRTPCAVSGCEVTRIDEGCYVLTLTGADAQIKWEAVK